MHSFILAALLTLGGGYNNPGAEGEIVAVSAATSNATATVAVKTVSTFTTYTNATAEVVSYEPAWALTYTNFDGEASISTNVLGRVNYDDFTTTNGVRKIIAGPTRFDMPFTNTVVLATLPAETFTATNDVATLTAAGHFAFAPITNKFLLGEAVLITGAEKTDTINILIK